MFIKNLHTPHGEKKFSEQKLLHILQNNIIVIHANTHGKEKFLDIQAQNFINKQTHSKRNLWNCTYTPNTFFLHLSELSTAIQDNYPQKKKPKKSKKKQIKIFKKAKKKPNTGYKDS
jgi:hypothetical protein